MDLPAWSRQLAAAATDLALGGACAGCAGSPGLLCSACRAELERPARVLERRPGGIPVVATCVYGGSVRSTVLAHKEHGRLALSRPLGDALSAAVTALLGSSNRGPDGRLARVALVPAPSAPAAVRRRGHDPLLRIVRRACVVLRRGGLDCAVVPALRHGRRVSDQAGLGHDARQTNLQGSMTIRSGAATLLAGRLVVIVDDVVTTGATIGEVARVLRTTGREPRGAAVIAAAP